MLDLVGWTARNCGGFGSEAISKANAAAHQNSPRSGTSSFCQASLNRALAQRFFDQPADRLRGIIGGREEALHPPPAAIAGDPRSTIYPVHGLEVHRPPRLGQQGFDRLALGALLWQQALLFIVVDTNSLVDDVATKCSER